MEAQADRSNRGTGMEDAERKFEADASPATRPAGKPWQTPRLDLLEIRDSEIPLVDLLDDRPLGS